LGGVGGGQQGADRGRVERDRLAEIDDYLLRSAVQECLQQQPS
jgi:hypothetical protein